MLDGLKKKVFQRKRFKVKVEAYLQSCRTSVMEAFFENN